MPTDTSDTGTWASRIVRNTVGLAAWTAAWVASLALAAFGPGILWNDQPAPTLLAIAFNVAIGVGMLFANKRHLQAQDELQRTIQLQAMAWSLGAGLVGGVAWTLFARHDIIGFEAEIGHLVAFMGLVYLAGSVAGLLRYR
jgi:predicted membrane channel-forming protein YqfA (hemolysin III family)